MEIKALAGVHAILVITIYLPPKVNYSLNNRAKINSTDEVTSDRPFSLGGHVESQENKKLCFCTASLALNSRLSEATRAKTKIFIHLRLNMAAEWERSIYANLFKGVTWITVTKSCPVAVSSCHLPIIWLFLCICIVVCSIPWLPWTSWERH